MPPEVTSDLILAARDRLGEVLGREVSAAEYHGFLAKLVLLTEKAVLRQLWNSRREGDDADPVQTRSA